MISFPSDVLLSLLFPTAKLCVKVLSLLSFFFFLISVQGQHLIHFPIRSDCTTQIQNYNDYNVKLATPNTWAEQTTQDHWYRLNRDLISMNLFVFYNYNYSHIYIWLCIHKSFAKFCSVNPHFFFQKWHAIKVLLQNNVLFNCINCYHYQIYWLHVTLNNKHFITLYRRKQIQVLKWNICVKERKNVSWKWF